MNNGKTVLCEVGVGPVSQAYGALVWSRPDVEVLLFEPHPTYYLELVAAAAGRQNVQIFNVAIGDEDGQMQFREEGTSSSLVGVASPSVQHTKLPDSSFPLVNVDVKKISQYDTGQIDILRVDTEGAEWFALKHLVSRPKQIVVEIYNDLATYINPYLYEIEAWAKQNGYRKVQIAEGDFIYQLS